MELKEFVNNAIVEILEGTKSAQDKMPNHINPPIRGGKDKRNFLWTDGHRVIQNIEFDVAVTTEETNSNGVSGRISVFGAGIGTKLDEDNLSKKVSRIKFSVPITYSTEKE